MQKKFFSLVPLSHKASYFSTDEKNDESMYNIDLSIGNKKKYMFSKFMHDQEEENHGNVIKSFNDGCGNEWKADIDNRLWPFSLTKTNSKSLLEGSDDDSDAETETDDDEEENREIARCSLIDSIVEAWCRGWWSTRDKLNCLFQNGSFTKAL